MKRIIQKLKLEFYEKIYFYYLNIGNFFSKKRNKALIISNFRIEENAIALGNYLALKTTLEVGLMLRKKDINKVKVYLEPSIEIYPLPSFYPFTKFSFRALRTSKYIYFTHYVPLGRSFGDQKKINIWHGVGHKKIQKARNNNGIQADYTIATSEITASMFSEFFEVPRNSVLCCGLPRNDLMLNSINKSTVLKKQFLNDFSSFSKILIWMPTFRQKIDNFGAAKPEIQTDNIFNIRDFNISKFDQILKESNTICLIKTHYFVTGFFNSKEHTNILKIDDEWLLDRGLLLYELLACTEALITDYSSVMIDYSLLDRPIFCMADDLEAYKKKQGLYFDDYENWVPTILFENQYNFLTAIEEFLCTEKDIYKEKRHKIRDVYFKFQDAKSAERILEQTFDDTELKNEGKTI